MDLITDAYGAEVAAAMRGDVNEPRPYKYTDGTGRRRSGTEYPVPRPRRR
jgi:hypothetical protein